MSVRGRYWIPRTRRELVDWFVKKDILTKSGAVKMSTKQLYGKYKEWRECYG